MGRTILVGLVVGAVAFVGMAFLSRGTPLGELLHPQPETVAELKAEVDPQQVERARVDPQSAAADVQPENYPVFLAFLDMDMAVTQPAADDYRQLFDRAVAHYSSNTPGQIVEAIFYIHDAIKYYPDLTYRECLEYLNDNIPQAADPGSENGTSPENVRTAAAKIHDWLVSSYMQPQMDEMERQRQERQALDRRINQNLAAARQRGAAANQARAQGIDHQYDHIQQTVNWQYNRMHSGAWNHWYYRYGRNPRHW